MFKDKCGFRDKVHVCNFKAENCTPDKCELYDLEFSSKAIKQRLLEEAEKFERLSEEVLDKKKHKEMALLESKDKKSKEVFEYKKKLFSFKDLGTGIKYLDKALRFCKRAGLL